MKARLLSLIEQILNGHVRESTAAVDRLKDLDGKRMSVELVGPDLSCTLIAADEKLAVEIGVDGTAEARLRGTPLALLEAFRSDGIDSFGTDRLTMAGDAQVAEEFATLLRLARPDLEEQLSHLTGDVLAHKVGRAFRDVGNWSAQALSAMLMNSSEFLQEESHALPARVEVERFFTDVDSLRESADRVSQKIERYLASADQAR
jgi:ubiquinone biosynthesis protein UbiJ